MLYGRIPKPASAAPSAAAGVWPEVKMIRAGEGASVAAIGPLKSATRRAIAGAGSMNVTGQGASWRMRSSRSG